MLYAALAPAAKVAGRYVVPPACTTVPAQVLVSRSAPFQAVFFLHLQPLLNTGGRCCTSPSHLLVTMMGAFQCQCGGEITLGQLMMAGICHSLLAGRG